MKLGAFLMYLVHAMLLNFGAEFRRNLIYNGHTLVGLLRVSYQEDGSLVQGIDGWECSGNAAISNTWKLGPLENYIAPTTVSKGCEEKM